MTKELPISPNIEHLKKEAKSILKAHKDNNPDCCATLKNLHHFSKKSDNYILNSKVLLSEVQFALSMEYGFSSWPELLASVRSVHTIQPDNVIAGFMQLYIQDQLDLLNSSVKQATGAQDVRWTPGTNGDRRWQGLEFLQTGGRLPIAWYASFPQDYCPPTWDIMGRVRRGGSSWERVFVWGVSHLTQLRGDCPTDNPESESMIEQLFGDAKRAFGVSESADWMNGYYPYALRLAVLGFLKNNKSCGRLLYLFGEEETQSSHIPTRAMWDEAITEVHNHLGLSGDSTLERRFHQYMLPIV